MKLTYRGQHYEASTFSDRVSESIVTGKYRGLPVRFASPVRVNPAASDLTLRYRGNVY